MTATTATLVHTSSREAGALLGIARVAAAGRVTAARVAREAREARMVESYREEGQFYDPFTGEVFCLVCGRATDHAGEHTPEQLDAWKARR